ncbi:MAG: DNA alkylation repair protein [Bacteroidetes bacterium]|nr:DNA alkylation repair protein [Bacteroidota bacterium]NCQ10833.1 DNA alkylation repair protein [Bacteroidota bacterium]
MNKEFPSIIENIETRFEALRNEENAYFMEKYMKGKFPFYGIKTPERREVLKEMKKLFPKEFAEEFISLSFACFEKPEREWHQFGVDCLLQNKKKLNVTHLDDIEWLILTHSWWDTVDMLAITCVGEILQKETSFRNEYIEHWRNHNSIWLNRTTLLFQLKYKQDIDVDLLADLIEQFRDSKEFFIQKAIGWILREYSATNPDWVRNYVTKTELKPLSKREAIRKMSNEK